MDTLDAMRVFVRVAEAGSFSGAARDLGLSKALVSKAVGRLEDRLGARLLNRTTRSLSLTEAGSGYLERCAGLLNELDDLERAVSDSHVAPRGRLRVSAPPAFASAHLAPLLTAFLADNPDITLDIDLSDRFVDIVEDGFDIAIRISEPSDSSLIARKLAPAPKIVVAAPDYLRTAPPLVELGDLALHSCLIDSNLRQPDNWMLRRPDGRTETVRVKGRIRINGLDTILDLLRAGHGIGLAPAFAVVDDIAAGRLVHCLAGRTVDQTTVHALFPPTRQLSGKVRAFVDMLVRDLKPLRHRCEILLGEPAP